MKVVVVAEYYPRAHDPVIGFWAHRQAMAARDAGADVRVLVMFRVIPPRATAVRDAPRAIATLLRQPRRATIDGIDVEYVPFVSPPRSRSYGTWGAWAAPGLALALLRLRRRGFRYDLLHAHYAVPAGDAVRRIRDRVRRPTPLIVSAHGGDGLFDTLDSPNVARAFAAAQLVLCNSRGTERRARRAGAGRTRIVHLGADVPAELPPKRPDPTLVTLAHLVGRKRQGDVLRALWVLRERHPRLRYLVIGDGPERARLEALTARLELTDRVEFTGQLPNREAVALAHTGHLFVLPSIDEAFGVAYTEAMAGGLPAIGCLGEPGPAELEDAGPGMTLVPPGDIDALAAAIDAHLSLSRRERMEQETLARRTIQDHFTWDACGEATVRAYRDVLAG